MSRRFVYPATVKRDEAGFYLVTFPDVQGAATDGETLEEALTEAVDCLEEAIASRLVRGDELPTPSAVGTHQYAITLPALMAVKALLTLELRKQGLSKVDLAKLIGSDEKEARRLLDPKHGSKLPRLEMALAALGKRLHVEVRKAS